MQSERMKEALQGVHQEENADGGDGETDKLDGDEGGSDVRDAFNLGVVRRQEQTEENLS